ncbi:MAG: ATP-binding protein [Gammaproteobacteria bacterium]
MQDYEKLGVFYLGRAFDPAQKALTDDLILYDSKDLTTHAVCVGMTGSGKTGLCLALLEEAAIDGIPAICIDPKGDLSNLLLTFPNLAPGDFEPWVDSGEAARKGVSVQDYAAQTAASWKKGLEQWGEPPERIKRFRDSVDLAIYTPGANTGLALSVLRSFAAPSAEVMADSTALRDRVGTLVSGLLALLGRDADPLKSREHILLSNILERTWRDGGSVDMAGLIAAVQKPPFDKVGAFELDTFFPVKDRLELAMAINNLLASPGFAAWMEGEPLDAQRLLFTPEGKPRISIISIAHLDDAERMFIVTLVLNELISWMRSQSGTSSLRALFYMDEIFGYFPPTANPPSKPPMLTLLKQGRAFGLGCVLATQNPVDLDYKGLSNAGTWLIGRLQTERDKMRVIDGLEGALAGDGNYDRATLDKMMSGLTQRVFLMRNVHDDAPVLFQSRWALSYLRGPLTGPEISRLMAEKKAAARTASGARTSSAASGAGAGADLGAGAGAGAGVGTRNSQSPSPRSNAVDGSTASVGAERADTSNTIASSRPSLPAGVPEYFLPATGTAADIEYKPMILGLAKLHFIDPKLSLDQWRTNAYLAPLSDDGTEALWSEAKITPDLKSRLTKSPAPNAAFASLPGPAMRAASYPAWSKSLSSNLYESARADVLVCDAIKAVSAPDEPEGDFRSRLTLSAREKRDAAVADLRKKYAPKLLSLDTRERAAQDRLAREKSQLSQQKLQTVLSVGASILGAFLGRKALSATNINRATQAARSATRIGNESGDVNRADESLEAVRQQRTDLQKQFETESASLEGALDAGAAALRKVQVSPRKSDIAVGEVALVWTPWRKGADGFPAPAFE